MLIRCHANAFTQVGIPRRCLYDSATVVVLGRTEAGQPIWKQRFLDLDLDRQAHAWADGVANVRIHGITHERPCERLVRIPVPCDPSLGWVNPNPAIVDQV